MNRRERLERKLERRAEWAEKADRRASSRFAAADDAIDGIPPGQPILIGHHSEGRHRRALELHDQRMQRAIEEQDRAKHHEEKAAGLAAQLDGSIFSDDDDAVESLEARISDLESERDRLKAYNASCRAGLPDESILDESQRADIASFRRLYNKGPRCQFPAYATTNLGANIRRLRKRLDEVRDRQARASAAASAPGGVAIVGGDYIAVTFAQKPSRDILDALKTAGYRWRGGSWYGYRASLPAGVAATA